MKYATVEFLSTKDTGYAEQFTYENPVNAKKYDAVIVPTKYGLSMAVVVSLSDTLPEMLYSTSKIKAIAEIIQSETVAKAMVARKRSDLKIQLDKEVKKLDAVQRYEMYAGESPVIAKLLKEYKGIAGE